MDYEGLLKSRQIKAARALLDWSQEDLAAKSGLSVNTIRKLELGHISPRGKTTRSIRQSFEDAGLEFIEFNGVRQKPEEIKVYQGVDGVIAFYDDVYQTISRKGGDIVIVATDPNLLWQMMGKFADVHRERMNALKGTFSCKCLITESTKVLPAPAYCEYRTISKSYVDSVPFYVYGDKYAIRTMNADPAPKIVVVQSRAVADTFRHQFYSMWDKATLVHQPEVVELSTKNKK